MEIFHYAWIKVITRLAYSGNYVIAVLCKILQFQLPVLAKWPHCSDMHYLNKHNSVSKLQNLAWQLTLTRLWYSNFPVYRSCSKLICASHKLTHSTWEEPIHTQFLVAPGWSSTKHTVKCIIHGVYNLWNLLGHLWKHKKRRFCVLNASWSAVFEHTSSFVCAKHRYSMSVLYSVTQISPCLE